MTAKMLLTTAIVALSPGLAMATCSWGQMEAASCAPGASWDSESRSCVVQGTS